jgi:DNA-binding response OmpR family regulator
MKEKILVIDTNLDLLQSIKNLLELYQFEVDLAVCGKEALDRITSNNYDLILADIHLPDINGLELLERVKLTINSEIPVVMMTGLITVDVVIKSINLGASDFIKKPFNDYQIHKAITRQINKRKKDFYFNNYNRYLMGTHYSFEFSASDYLDFNITDFLVSHLVRLKELTPAVCNELSLCIEEMLSNAFIHGTFEIGSSYKTMSHSEYSQKIKELLLDPQINKRIVSIDIRFRKKAKVVSIAVTDQGKGYDNNHFRDDDKDNIFRGLSLIKILADKVEILDQGRTIKVEKTIDRKALKKTQQ